MHLRGVILLPVNRDVVTSFVNDVDDEGIAVIHLQRRPRVHSVHRDRVVGFAQPLHRLRLNLFQTKILLYDIFMYILDCLQQVFLTVLKNFLVFEKPILSVVSSSMKALRNYSRRIDVCELWPLLEG